MKAPDNSLMIKHRSKARLNRQERTRCSTHNQAKSHEQAPQAWHTLYVASLIHLHPPSRLTEARYTTPTLVINRSTICDMFPLRVTYARYAAPTLLLVRYTTGNTYSSHQQKHDMRHVSFSSDISTIGNICSSTDHKNNRQHPLF